MKQVLLFCQVEKVKTSYHVQPPPEAKQIALSGVANLEYSNPEWTFKMRFAMWNPDWREKERRRGEWRTQSKERHWLPWLAYLGCIYRVIEAGFPIHVKFRMVPQMWYSWGNVHFLRHCFSVAFVTVLIRVSIPAMKHHDKKASWQEKVYSLYTMQ